MIWRGIWHVSDLCVRFCPGVHSGAHGAVDSGGTASSDVDGFATDVDGFSTEVDGFAIDSRGSATSPHFCGAMNFDGRHTSRGTATSDVAGFAFGFSGRHFGAAVAIPRRITSDHVDGLAIVDTSTS